MTLKEDALIFRQKIIREYLGKNENDISEIEESLIKFWAIVYGNRAW